MARVSNHQPEVIDEVNASPRLYRPRCTVCGSPTWFDSDLGHVCPTCDRWEPADQVYYVIAQPVPATR